MAWIFNEVAWFRTDQFLGQSCWYYLYNIIINSLLNGDDYHRYGIDYNSMASLMQISTSSWLKFRNREVQEQLINQYCFLPSEISFLWKTYSKFWYTLIHSEGKSHKKKLYGYCIKISTASKHGKNSMRTSFNWHRVGMYS